MTWNEFMASNKALWDEWTDIHEASDFYDLRSFIENGDHRSGRGAAAGVRLRSYEIEEVGDVTGRSLLHLQCHFGIDTLSWARLGARVTGVDFSPKSLALARKVADETKLDARFIESNIYDLPDVLEETFDIVYTSRGVIGWLPHIKPWAEVVARFVRPGGIFYITEVHPIIQIFDDLAPPGELRPVFPYFEGDVIGFETEGSYADRSAVVETAKEYGWNHGLGEIVTALAQAGLRIDLLHELPFVEWPMGFLEQWEDGTWRLPKDSGAEMPMFFSLRASKPLTR